MMSTANPPLRTYHPILDGCLGVVDVDVDVDVEGTAEADFVSKAAAWLSRLIWLKSIFSN